MTKKARQITVPSGSRVKTILRKFYDIREFCTRTTFLRGVPPDDLESKIVIACARVRQRFTDDVFA